MKLAGINVRQMRKKNRKAATEDGLWRTNKVVRKKSEMPERG